MSDDYHYYLFPNLTFNITAVSFGFFNESVRAPPEADIGEVEEAPTRHRPEQDVLRHAELRTRAGRRGRAPAASA